MLKLGEADFPNPNLAYQLGEEDLAGFGPLTWSSTSPVHI